MSGWLSLWREKRPKNDQKWGWAAKWWPDKTRLSQIGRRGGGQIGNFIHSEYFHIQGYPRLVDCGCLPWRLCRASFSFLMLEVAWASIALMLLIAVTCHTQKCGPCMGGLGYGGFVHGPWPLVSVMVNKVIVVMAGDNCERWGFWWCTRFEAQEIWCSVCTSRDFGRCREFNNLIIGNSYFMAVLCRVWCQWWWRLLEYSFVVYLIDLAYINLNNVYSLRRCPLGAHQGCCWGTVKAAK